MAFCGKYPLSDIDKVRLSVGDTDSDYEILSDDVYQYILSKYTNNVNRAAIEAAKCVLFGLTKFTRERTGQIEVYGSEWASNYRHALELFIKNPNLGIFNPMPYAGGISKTDMAANDAENDNVRPRLYAGFVDGIKTYNKLNSINNESMSGGL